ncbi:hypothetical protein CAEBREN_31889 [Caenorhabditis brenneri]|uniref:Phospholipid scramblase n=1 Tax=Caenorhabditis brenneri TaxID=135651 RepID=G0M9D4_CAEBE|nr:hypothetical protein CAEBREN_31889 [Caenorhabditis brenneri]
MQNPHYIPVVDQQPVQLFHSDGMYSPPPMYQPPTVTQQPGVLKPNDGVHLQPTAIVQQPNGAAVPAAPGSVWMPLPPTIPGVPPGLEYLTQLDMIQIYQIKELIEILTNWDTKNKYVMKNANGEQCYYAFEESDCCERQLCGPQRGFVMHIVDNFKRIRTANTDQVIGAITKKWGGFFREAFTRADTFFVGFPKDLDVKLKGVLLGATFLIDFMQFEQPNNNSSY